MNIKKLKNNQYIQGGGVWVRNFTGDNKNPLAVSHLYSREDYEIVTQNEHVNSVRPKISDEILSFQKVVIVSDGYNFQERHQLIEKMPKDVCVLAINGALKDWKLTGKRSINAYVVNNPYKECMRFMPKPKGYYPVCVSSIRTNYNFTKQYKNDIYVYCPTPELTFGTEYAEKYFIDDYRNPVCAAIGLAYQFGVEKLMLMCCDESFKQQRDFAVQLKNGLWTYPQHIRSREIIDANLYWLTHQENKEVSVVDFSDGGDYFNATYINEEKDALSFFTNGEEPNNGAT
jgi:hypothetical protein